MFKRKLLIIFTCLLLLITSNVFSADVIYDKQNEWSVGFTCQIKITNDGTTALEDWTLSFDFPGNQTITDGWCADFTQTGQSVSAKCLAWNRVLGPGQSVTIGFNASFSGANDVPASFTVTTGGNNNEAPTATITDPVNGQEFLTGADITITATAADTDGTVKSVEFFEGSTSLGIDTTAPYSVTWNNVQPGNYSLKAVATDNENATGDSALVNIIVNDVPNEDPTTSITSPLTGAEFEEGNPIIIAADAADTDGVVTLVEFFANGLKIGEDSTSPYSFTWNTATGGNYDLTTVATDNKNGKGTSTVVSIKVNGNIPPTVSIISPADGAIFDEGECITINVDAADIDGSVVKVELFIDGVLYAEDIVSPYVFTVCDLTVGAHSIVIRVTDDKNAVVESNAVSISVKGNEPPTAVIIAPANMDKFDVGEPITITATASDTDGTISVVEFYEGNNKLGEDSVAPYEIVWTDAVENMYNLKAIAYDDDNASGESAPVTITVGVQGNHNYGEVLQKAIWFYDVQRSGVMPANNRVSWKADSCVGDSERNLYYTDGTSAGRTVDMSKGWYDAGDHIKFSLPMAASVTMLLWGVYENTDAYTDSGQLEYLLDNVKWATDYFINCKEQVGADEFIVQLSDKPNDHIDVWVSSEIVEKRVEDKGYERKAYLADLDHPASTPIAEVAAALAITSIIFNDETKSGSFYDPAYASKCLSIAEELLALAKQMNGDSGYHDIPSVPDTYKSWSGFYDEYQWASVWLHIANDLRGNTAKAQQYLDDAESYVDLIPRDGPQTPDIIDYRWTQDWDNKHYGAMLMLAKLTGKAEYNTFMEKHFDFWHDKNKFSSMGKQGGKYTDGGLAWLYMWGPLRYLSNEMFMQLNYAKYTQNTALIEKIMTFTQEQMGYILGENPLQMSYVIGYGDKWCQQPHHRAAHATWDCKDNSPVPTRHILYGALVGGPDSDDTFDDNRKTYERTEVACDYNSGFVGALAYMYKLYGGNPLTNFPVAETPDGPEIFMEASINVDGNAFTQLQFMVRNHSAWPARMIKDLRFRYYFDLTEAFAEGFTVSDVYTKLGYVQNKKDCTVSPIMKHSGNIYYFEVTFLDGTNTYPGGDSEHRAEIQLSVGLEDPTNTKNINVWDRTNDYSCEGLLTGHGSLTTTSNITMYDGDTLIWGVEP